MLAVRQFACDACGTAHADVEEPPRCAACGATALTELDRADGARDYFAPVAARDDA